MIGKFKSDYCHEIVLRILNVILALSHKRYIHNHQKNAEVKK